MGTTTKTYKKDHMESKNGLTSTTTNDDDPHNEMKSLSLKMPNCCHDASKLRRESNASQSSISMSSCSSVIMTDSNLQQHRQQSLAAPTTLPGPQMTADSTLEPTVVTAAVSHNRTHGGTQQDQKSSSSSASSINKPFVQQHLHTKPSAEDESRNKLASLPPPNIVVTPTPNKSQTRCCIPESSTDNEIDTLTTNVGNFSSPEQSPPWTFSSSRSLPPLCERLEKDLLLFSNDQTQTTVAATAASDDRKKKSSSSYIALVKFPLNEECTSLKFSPSGRLVIGGFADGTVRLFDLTGHFKKSSVAANKRASLSSTTKASTNTTSSGGSSILLDSKDHQLFGAVAGQIHAKGVHTSLLMTVDVAEDCRWCFAGVLRGSMELLALDLTELEQEFDRYAMNNHARQKTTTDNIPTSHCPIQDGNKRENDEEEEEEDKNMLDCVTVYRHADAKLRGFGACTRLQHSESYLLFSGKAIKNIHIWKFTPPSPTSSVNDVDALPTWVQLYNTQTNGTTIQFLHFRRILGQDENGRSITTQLQALSKSDGQKLRVWDLTHEDQPPKHSSSSPPNQQAHSTRGERESSNNEVARKRPPYFDVPNTEAALVVAGHLCLCGGSDLYNQMSLVSLEASLGSGHSSKTANNDNCRFDNNNNSTGSKSAASNWFNHTELALPGATASPVDEVRRRPGRGDLKCLEAAFTTGYDSNHVLLQLSDGTVWNYNPQPSSFSSSTSSTAANANISSSFCSPLAHPAFDILPSGIHRCLGVGRVGQPGLALAAAAIYSASRNKGRLIIVPMDHDPSAGLERSRDRPGFWGYVDTTITASTAMMATPTATSKAFNEANNQTNHRLPPTPLLKNTQSHEKEINRSERKQFVTPASSVASVNFSTSPSSLSSLGSQSQTTNGVQSNSLSESYSGENSPHKKSIESSPSSPPLHQPSNDNDDDGNNTATMHDCLTPTTAVVHTSKTLSPSEFNSTDETIPSKRAEGQSRMACLDKLTECSQAATCSEKNLLPSSQSKTEQQPEEHSSLSSPSDPRKRAMLSELSRNIAFPKQRKRQIENIKKEDVPATCIIAPTNSKTAAFKRPRVVSKQTESDNAIKHSKHPIPRTAAAGDSNLPPASSLTAAVALAATTSRKSNGISLKTNDHGQHSAPAEEEEEEEHEAAKIIALLHRREPLGDDDDVRKDDCVVSESDKGSSSPSMGTRHEDKLKHFVLCEAPGPCEDPAQPLGCGNNDLVKVLPVMATPRIEQHFSGSRRITPEKGKVVEKKINTTTTVEVSWSPPAIPRARSCAEIAATLNALEERMSYNRTWLMQYKLEHYCRQPPLLSKAITLRVNQDAAQTRLCQQLWKMVQTLQKEKDSHRRTNAMSMWQATAQSLLQWQQLELDDPSLLSLPSQQQDALSGASTSSSKKDGLDCRAHYISAQTCLHNAFMPPPLPA
ncbi:hypothetical protein ACA910_013520 [Epithemia clementina (nom. ined.)]